MRPMEIAICDDEPLAAERLQRMVEGIGGTKVVATFGSGEELLERFTQADVLLLDVDMPKVDGFDVVEALSRRAWQDEAPLVVFVTAHARFALEAFDSGAIDFLTKPVRLTRLERALERARTALENREARRRLAEVAEQLDRLKLAHSARHQEPFLWLRRGSELERIAVEDIDWIGAEGECVRYHSGETSYLERRPIGEVAERLAPFGFRRIHRSTIVNPDRVQALTRTRWGSMVLRLRSGVELRVSKPFQGEVRRLTGRNAGR